MKYQFIILVIGLQLIVFSGNAQEAEINSGNIPNLNDHSFIDNPLIFSAFTKTKINQKLGIGFSTSIDNPTIKIGNYSITPARGTLIYAQLFFNYQQRIKDWVAFYFSLSASGRVGSDPSSLLTQGVNTLVGTSMGWKIKLFSNENHFLSTALGITDHSANVVNVLEYTQDVANGVPNASLSTNVSALHGNLGIQYAYGISSLFGTQAMARFSYGDAYEEGKSGFQYFIAGAFDANLYKKTSAPLGLSLGLGYGTIPEANFTTDYQSLFYNFKISYTGTPDLLFGLETSGYESQLDFEIDNVNYVKTIRVFSFALSMIYYFN